MPVANASGIYPDQTLRSDLSLHCLLCPIYGTLGTNGLKKQTNVIYSGKYVPSNNQIFCFDIYQFIWLSIFADHLIS